MAALWDEKTATMVRWPSWLRHFPVKEEITGSNPVRIALVSDWNYARRFPRLGLRCTGLVTTKQENSVRSEEEIKAVRETFERELAEYDDDEQLQAIVDVLNWVLGDVDISTLEGYRSV